MADQQTLLTKLNSSKPSSLEAVHLSSKFSEGSLQHLQQTARYTNRSGAIKSNSTSASAFDRLGQGLSRVSQGLSRVVRRVYRGRSTTTIGQINLSTGRPFNIRSRRTVASAVITRPQRAGGVRETNPFNLSISSSPSEVSSLKEGAFSMFSAIPYDFRGGFLVQHWQFQYRNNRIFGRLTNTGAQYSLATNQINVNESILNSFVPSQITMSRGTQITGTITARAVRVRIQGTGVSLFSQQYAFVIDTVLRR